MFRNCTFENNVASDGGALWLLNGATTTINGCTFKGNSASGTGGAISITTYDSILNGDNNIITGNTAKTGGGIHNSGRLLLTNSLIYGNNGTMGADILNTMAGVTDIGSLDEVREAYHAIGLNPLEWVNDYDGTSFVDANVNTEKEDAFMKLSYEDYVAPAPDPEPSIEDPQPSTEPSSEPSQEEEPKTEPSTEPSEEPKTEPVATPSEAEKTPTPSVSSGDSKPTVTPTSTPASTTTNNSSTDNSRTDRSVTTNNYNNVTPKPEQQTNPPAQAQAQPEKEQNKTPQQTAQNEQKQPLQTKVEQSNPEQSEGAEQATQEVTEGDVMKIDPSNNIRIDAKNSDVVFEVKDGVYSITVNSAATTAPATESTQGVNWYEIVKILLLGAIVVVMLWKPKTKEK